MTLLTLSEKRKQEIREDCHDEVFVRNRASYHFVNDEERLAAVTKWLDWYFEPIDLEASTERMNAPALHYPQIFSGSSDQGSSIPDQPCSMRREDPSKSQQANGSTQDR